MMPLAGYFNNTEEALDAICRGCVKENGCIDDPKNTAGCNDFYLINLGDTPECVAMVMNAPRCANRMEA